MKIYRSKIILASFIALLFLSANLNITFADNKAKEFSLKDQFGKVHDYKFPREKISILAFADKDGSEQLEAWIRPLYEKYGDKIDIHGVAELSAVPSIARGIVRVMIKKKSKHSVMLDWKGEVSKNYSYEKDKANIVLIDAKGNIVAREVGATDAKKLDEFYKKVDKLLN